MTSADSSRQDPPAASHEQPVILVCDDLFFQSKLEIMVRETGYRAMPLALPLDWKNTQPQVASSAIAVIVDLELQKNAAVEVIEWICKKLPRLPVIAFGPHVKKEALVDASRAGATHSWPRSRLVRELPTLLHELASARSK